MMRKANEKNVQEKDSYESWNGISGSRYSGRGS